MNNDSANTTPKIYKYTTYFSRQKLSTERGFQIKCYELRNYFPRPASFVICEIKLRNCDVVSSERL